MTTFCASMIVLTDTAKSPENTCHAPRIILYKPHIQHGRCYSPITLILLDLLERIWKTLKYYM